MLQLNEREWADFLLTDYFEIAKGNQNNMAELQAGAMPLISAKKIDNASLSVDTPAKCCCKSKKRETDSDSKFAKS